MHLSGILVVTDPNRLAACRRALEALPGVEVHHEHRPTGRLIAVLESETLAGQQEGLRRIQALPAVRLAALVEHRRDDRDALPPDRPENRPADHPEDRLEDHPEEVTP